MSLVPPASSTAAAAGGLNPGASSRSPGTGGASSSAFAQVVGVISSQDVLMNGGLMLAEANNGSTTWPLANAAILQPFVLPTAQSVFGFMWTNGGTVSGNLDVGIYNIDGTRVVSAGSTAQAGISSVQTVTVTTTALAAGSYFAAMAFDNVTATINHAGAVVPTMNCGGVKQAAGSFVLPASLTPIDSTFTMYPQLVVALGSVF